MQVDKPEVVQWIGRIHRHFHGDEACEPNIRSDKLAIKFYHPQNGGIVAFLSEHW